jgi:hypothetical protein
LFAGDLVWSLFQTDCAARATKHDGYDNHASARFMPAPEISLALMAAGSVFVADREDGVPHRSSASRSASG